MILSVSPEYEKLVPLLSSEEYESLKESIKENGLWLPILCNAEGVILDGHHRFRACIELKLIHYVPDSQMAFYHSQKLQQY